MSSRQLLLIILICGFNHWAGASSILPASRADLIGASGAVFRGTVVGRTSYISPDDGQIHTRTQLRVDEVFKGTFPPVIQVVHWGGSVGAASQLDGFAPRFRLFGEYLLYLTRNPDGNLECTQGSASAIQLHRSQSDRAAANPTGFVVDDEALLEDVRRLTDQGRLAGEDVTDQAANVQAGARGDSGGGTQGDVTANGLLDDGGGKSARFIQPDRGEPVPYLIDADYLPAGISFSDATNAVRLALDAWVNVTSLKFQFEGIRSFGMASPNVATNDGKLRIQLHDHYDFITETNVLGKGGRGGLTSVLPGTDWDIGGNVNGHEFLRSSRGYVVLKHDHPVMSTLKTFEEVLCHEIGHALSMAHSSESTNEVNNTLLESIMYFQTHKDGRGATLGSYDPPVIQQAYPYNTPPYTFSRILDVVSAPFTPDVAGINEVELRGYDLQSSALSVILTNVQGFNGTWSSVGNVIKFAPAGYFADSPRYDPDSSTLDRLKFRFSDGTNASPYAELQVLSLSGDSEPYPTSDGIPDNWMQAHFGTTTPAGNYAASANYDNDKLSNLQEYISGNTPTDPSSEQRIVSFRDGTLQFQGRPYDLFEIQGTTNFIDWSLVIPPLVAPDPLGLVTLVPPTNSVVTATNVPMTGDYRMIRVVRVP